MVKNQSQKSFDGQRDGEKVLFVFRRSVFTVCKSFCIGILLFIFLGLPYFLLSRNNVITQVILAIGGILGALIIIKSIIVWYFSVYVVTDQRLRQVSQRGFFSTNVIDLPLSKIHNISYNIRGLVGTIFNFGTIIIQTIAGDLTIRNISQPEKNYNQLQDAVANSSLNNQVKYE